MIIEGKKRREEKEEKREIGIDREKQTRLDRNQERDRIRERDGNVGFK